MHVSPSARLGLTVALLAAAWPAAAPAQLVSPKTIPVATGDQFLIHPSARLGMGGLSVALDDPLLDPIVNPARGGTARGGLLYGAPTYYSISDDNGDAITLPLGGRFAGGRWFGGAAVAAQQVEAAQTWGERAWPAIDLWIPQPQRLSERSADNLFASASLGRRLADGRTAVGISASLASLQAVDGVELLYALSQRIEQEGHTVDVRLGLTRDLADGATAEAILLHNRFDMTHDVTYLDFLPGTTWQPVVRTRVERNEDRTDTWGAHLGYRRPMGSQGVQVGGIATLNYKTHPKIPNYEIMNIPRDPGHTWAYNVGAGVAKVEGPATVGMELVLEPIWSHTYADAAGPVQTADGRVIPAGAKTVENDFVFTNALLRLGVSREIAERYGFQLGLQARAIRYELDQDDHVRAIRRQQRESWAEWTPTWGLSARFPEVELRYAGRLTTGTGRPGVEWTNLRAADFATLASATFLPAPGGPLTLQEARVLTHQVMVAVPLR